MPATVAVTGATGFIGRRLLDALVSNGWQVRALTRRPHTQRPAIHWVTGDLDNSDALASLVEGVSAVIHLAGQVRGNSLEHFLQHNVRGTENLLAAVKGADLRPRLLLISSLAAREPQLSWYAYSKQQAETVLQQQAGDTPWTIFRPTAVYGPGDQELSPLFRATRLGLLPMTGAPGSRFSLIHVDDLIAAMLQWLGLNEVPRNIYELDDGTVGGYDRNLVKTVAGQVWRRKVRVFTVPQQLVGLVAGVNLLISRLLGYAPMLTPGKVRELTHPDWTCDSAPYTAISGWRPGISLREALPAAIGIPIQPTQQR